MIVSTSPMVDAGTIRCYLLTTMGELSNETITKVDGVDEEVQDYVECNSSRSLTAMTCPTVCTSNSRSSGRVHHYGRLAQSGLESQQR